MHLQAAEDRNDRILAALRTIKATTREILEQVEEERRLDKLKVRRVYLIILFIYRKRIM
jgi:hypothetical protein